MLLIAVRPPYMNCNTYHIADREGKSHSTPWAHGGSKYHSNSSFSLCLAVLTLTRQPSNPVRRQLTALDSHRTKPGSSFSSPCILVRTHPETTTYFYYFCSFLLFSFHFIHSTSSTRIYFQESSRIYFLDSALKKIEMSSISPMFSLRNIEDGPSHSEK